MYERSTVDQINAGRERIEQLKQEIDQALEPVMPEDWDGHNRLDNYED